MNGFGRTDVGKKRNTNQDYVYVLDEPIGPFPNLYVVADGMGGHKAGDHASSYAVHCLVEMLRETSFSESPVSTLRTILKEVNIRVVKEAASKEEYNGMGTTMVVVVIIDETAYVANIGDSRLYELNDGMIRQVTIDHSLVEELVQSGQLTSEEARMHPRKNIITRAIGVMEDAEPDFYEIEMNKGKRLLMCTDGLSNMVEDKSICEIGSLEEPIEKVVMKLIDVANENGGLDNIGVVMIENN